MTLPKFLLAWSDFNWLWLYAKLRPAKDARWIFTRTLALTLLVSGLAALAGFLIGLAAYRQPVGWLPWLLGLWWGCIGLCWFGVTGLCWNQRAATLQTDPAQPAALPRSRFRFGRWCLGAIYIAVLGIITPLALMVTVENIRGEIAWKRERSRLIAAEEKLTFREILGPEIPPDQNAGAAPVFAPFFDYQFNQATLVRGGEGEDYYVSGLVWAQSNRVDELERAFNSPSSYLPESPEGSHNAPITPQIKIADWSAAYRSAIAKPKDEDAAWMRGLKLPPPGDPARDVLAGLASADKELVDVCAAAARPRSQFPLHYDEAFDCLLRHLAMMKGVQQTLQLRCAAHLALGEVDAAFADATNALNVAGLLREEPLLLSHLVLIAQGKLAISTVWQGLADHGWTDVQLGEFQRLLGQVDYLSSLALAFEGERAAGYTSMERLINESATRESFMDEESRLATLLQPISRGMLRQNQTTLIRYQSEALVGLRAGNSNASMSGLTALLHSDDAKLESYFTMSPSPFNSFVRMLAPATGRAINKTARAHTTVKLAIVACALERHRLAHGSYPETLDALAPLFAAGVPLDPMVNKPFHYQRTDDGWFQLYSVGPNGTDDGGVMRADDKKDTKDKQDKDWPWPVPTRPAKVRLF